ncbi:MAG: hypothetical protein HGB20_05880 [Chlorobiaceae bacterium]|nr:hypothetical protein [Chlorobiaceae bacterium]
MIKRFLLLFPALLVVFSFLSDPVQSGTGRIKLEPQTALSLFTGLVEEHIASILRTERALALTTEARSGRWEAVKPMLDSFSKDLPTDATLWYALPDGSYYITETGKLADQNLKDRTYFPKLLAAQEVSGELVISKSTGHRSVIVAVPVTLNDKVIAAIGASVRVHLISDLVSAHMTLPENTYFYALDPGAKIVIHRYAERLFKNVDDVADENLGDAFRNVMKTDEGTFDYQLNGKKITSIYQKSIPLGWYFFIAQEKK